MTHHRDAHAHESIDDRNRFRFSPLQFHGCRIRFLEESARHGHRLLFTALVAEERQIANDEGLLRRWIPEATHHGLGVMQHLVRRDGQRGRVAESHHRQRIPDQHSIGTGRFDQRR